MQAWISNCVEKHDHCKIDHIYPTTALPTRVIDVGLPEQQQLAMELRRLGLASKVLIVAPNDIVQQFAEEFQRFYPLARLLVPGNDDFTPAPSK